MARLGIVFCALLLSGCNSVLPGMSAPEASVPPAQAEGASDVPGVIVHPPLADLDCAPRAGAVTCP